MFLVTSQFSGNGLDQPRLATCTFHPPLHQNHSTRTLLLFEHTAREVNNLSFFCDLSNAMHESLVCRILLNIIISVFSTLELNDKCVCNAILSQSKKRN